jgi:hypothetical protein
MENGKRNTEYGRKGKMQKAKCKIKKIKSRKKQRGREKENQKD